MFYANLVSAEVFGTTGTARIIDLQANTQNTYTPAYAIYENNALSKLAIFNYLDDPTGANNNIVSIQFSDGAVPASVRVKYVFYKTSSLAYLIKFVDIFCRNLYPLSATSVGPDRLLAEFIKVTAAFKDKRISRP